MDLIAGGVIIRDVPGYPSIVNAFFLVQEEEKTQKREIPSDLT